MGLDVLNLLSLSGKTFLVTGASSGIGRIAAMLFAQLGASLALVARNQDRLQETLMRLEGKGHRSYSFDLNQIEEIPNLVKLIISDTGPLSGIFHSAGIAPMLSIKSVKHSTIISPFMTCAFASLMFGKAFCLKGVKAQGGASLVFMSSAAALTGTKGLSVYASSKAAVDGAVRAMAVELAEKNIRVNSIAAGMVQTEMHAALLDGMSDEAVEERRRQHPLGFGEPMDVAMTAAFLLSDASKWITGTTMVVDGGFSISR